MSSDFEFDMAVPNSNNNTLYCVHLAEQRDFY